MRYYAQYKCTFVHNVRINNVLKQCVRLLYTYNLNSEENRVGPDSRQVPAFMLMMHSFGDLDFTILKVGLQSWMLSDNTELLKIIVVLFVSCSDNKNVNIHNSYTGFFISFSNFIRCTSAGLLATTISFSSFALSVFVSSAIVINRAHK